MNEAEKERLIKKDLVSIENRVRHAFNQGYEMGLKENKELSGDAISRQAIKQKLQEHHDFYVDAYGGFNNLSLNDKSRVDEITACIAMVVNEPPVTPQQRTGRWIDDKCSVCGKGIEDLIASPEWYRAEEPNFCPFCGTKMEEVKK